LRKNFWYSETNSDKLCTKGAVANLLYHCNMVQDAEEFRQLAVGQTVDKIKRLMNVNGIPKRVIDKRHGIDPIEKCIWILEKRFNCRRLGLVLNPSHFGTASNIVKHLQQVQLPVLLSVAGMNSLYNHVVIVWKNEIIDFEAEYTYRLTVPNMDRVCGPNNPLAKLNRGYIILPSRKMKQCVGDFSDWGETIMKDNLHHLFVK